MNEQVTKQTDNEMFSEKETILRRPAHIITLLILVAAFLFLVAASIGYIEFRHISLANLRINFVALLFVPIIAMVTALIGALIISHQNRNKSLVEIREAINAAAGGDLNSQLEVKGSGVIADLREGFNRMSAAIELDTDEIRRERNRYHSVHQAITDGIIVFDRLGRVISANPAAEVAMGLLEDEMRGKWQIGDREIERVITDADIVPDEQRKKCWQVKNCTQISCPSYESSDLRCWLQCGTFCHNEIQGTFSQKRDACERCDVFMRNGIKITELEKDGRYYSVTISPILNDFGHEEGRMALFHDISELRSTAHILARRNLELTVLNEIVSSLSGSLDDVDLVLKDVLTKLTKFFGVPAGVILLNEKGGSGARIAAHEGISPQTTVMLQLVGVMKGLDEFMNVTSGAVDAERLLERHISVRKMLDKERLSNPLIFPVSVKGKIIGALMLIGGDMAKHDENCVRLVSAVAAQIGAAVQNQELYRKVTSAKLAWETTFDSMTDGVSVHDADHNIIRANQGMASLLGTTKEKLIGSKCYRSMHGGDSPIAQCPRQEVMKTGKGVSMEIEEPWLNKVMRLTVNPVFGDDGDILGMVHVVRDITERKRMREQLLQSEKMAAVGQLVSGVAHELNNPLTGVIGYAQLMMRRCQDGCEQPAIKDVEAILSEAQRASKIVQSLLSFARKYKPQKCEVDLNEAIRSVINLRSYDLNVRNIKLDTDLDPGLPRVVADLHQMEQVLLNIINNAEQAIDTAQGQGIISVRTRSDGDSIRAEIVDNGAGIASEDLAHIFDPFFTTKEIGKGTGLGLSICYGIVEEHGGEIRVSSRKDVGTTMTIELPACTDSHPVSAINPGIKTSDENRSRVLVVDDEPAIVELLTDILTMDGHGVDIAKNGKMAMQKLSCGSYDHVITDINMPQMDGRELYRRISEIDPSLAANVIFITGDSVSRDTREYLDSTGNYYLVKPFDLNNLREMLNKVLNKK
ncbi:MAG: response regulator [Actinobacteria bacterium]|nr:response regulator [Actinomycetota bacterium]